MMSLLLLATLLLVPVCRGTGHLVCHLSPLASAYWWMAMPSARRRRSPLAISFPSAVRIDEALAPQPPVDYEGLATRVDP